MAGYNHRRGMSNNAVDSYRRNQKPVSRITVQDLRDAGVYISLEAKAQPTSTLDQTTYYAELFASCNGRYSGEAKEGRREAAQITLTPGLRTLSEIIDIVAENCQ